MGTITGPDCRFPYEDHGKCHVERVSFNWKMLPPWWDRHVEAEIRCQNSNKMAPWERQARWGEGTLIRKAKSSYVVVLQWGRYHVCQNLKPLWRSQGPSKFVWECHSTRVHLCECRREHCEQNLVLGISNCCLFTMRAYLDTIHLSNLKPLLVTEALGGSESLRGRVVVLDLSHRDRWLFWLLGGVWDVPILKEKGKQRVLSICRADRYSDAGFGVTTTFLRYYLESVWDIHTNA